MGLMENDTGPVAGAEKNDDFGFMDLFKQGRLFCLYHLTDMR